MADAVLMTTAEQAPPLALRTAHMAARLADLVGGIGADAEPSIERFLRAMAASPAAAATASQPLERLAIALRLALAEIDLVVLAGLAEEHEGYAAALRRLSPTNDPFATCGLASQILAPGTTDRLWLRDLLERGSAVSAGALTVGGDGPLFERGLRVGERLWPVLHDIDVWPAAVHRSVEPIELDGLEEWLVSVPVRRAAAAITRGTAVTILVT